METSPNAPADLRLDAFVRQYRSMAPLRLTLPLVMTLLLGTVAPLSFTIGFGLLHMALYVVFFWAVEVGAREKVDAADGLRKLTVRTGLITSLITLHACWMALAVRGFSTEPFIRAEAALVIIGVLMLTATQTHMSRIGYLAGIGPALGALLWIAIDTKGGGAPNPHFLVVVCVFLLAVIAVTWRQQETSLALRVARLDLENKNATLVDLVARAEAAQAQAEAASRAKSDFLAMTSHEIRTPLNAVLGLAEALARSKLPIRQHGMARGVVDAGALLKRLLDAMLDISRIEAGKMSLSPSPFDPRRTLETIALVWSPRAEEAGVDLVVELDGLPDACGLIADGGKIEQVLINLISNAVKFSPRGGTVTVRLAATPVGVQGWAVEAVVLDQGPGVPEEERGRIFRAFEQAQAGRERGGAGLGLAICVGNLDLMGGTIAVDDAPGGGAAFRIGFVAPACDLGQEAATEIDAPVLDEGRPLRVLAAEDNAANRHVLQALFEPLPVELTLAENGADALAAMEDDTFDMILMDANMPVMDGLTALRQIRAAGDRVPVWMLTANVFDEDVARYRAAGADGVVRKPIELEELFAALSEAAGRAEAAETPVAA